MRSARNIRRKVGTYTLQPASQTYDVTSKKSPLNWAHPRIRRLTEPHAEHHAHSTKDHRGLRDKMEAGFTDIRQSIAKLSVDVEIAYGKLRVATVETRVWALITLGGILLLMARTFKRI